MRKPTRPGRLTQAKVGEKMQWSLQKVARLRLSGQLLYFSGRPALIDEADLEAYIERKRRAKEPPLRRHLLPAKLESR